MSNQDTFQLEFQTIKSSLSRDYKHFKEQMEFLDESIQLGESLTGEDFSYLKSLKDEYNNKQEEILALYIEMKQEFMNIDRELKKQKWKLIYGGNNTVSLD